MVKSARAAVYSIPAHRGFADALATGLIDRFAKEERGLADGIVLLPNNRAARAVTEAFVRRAEPGLLLPRLVAIGDLDLGEQLGNALDPIGDAPDIPPAISPLHRQMILGRLVSRLFAGRHQPVSAAEALRMGGELGQVIDQLLVERITPAALMALDVGADLSAHWQISLEVFALLFEEWPRELAVLGMIDMAARRNILLDHVAARWAVSPPAGFVVAAGISSNAPALAALLRTIAHNPRGMVVLSDVDLAMADEDWDLIGPHRAPADGTMPRRSLETHPQFHLKLLLDQMGVNRAEVMRWTRSGESDAPPQRSRAISNAFLPAERTVLWQSLDNRQRSLSGITLLEADDSAEEAQVIAIAIREALEEPQKRVALVTPDRELARRVSAHLERWEIVADDSAGRALSELPQGSLLLALMDAAASNFAPVELLALLKHPFTMAGGERIAWLDHVRALDHVLRGPRPAPGLGAISRLISERLKESGATDVALLSAWWDKVRAQLAPLASLPLTAPGQTVAALIDIAGTLTNQSVWNGQAGRELARFLTEWQAWSDAGPAFTSVEEAGAVLALLLAGQSVRPAYGSHPRVAIYGLLEARLQQADLTICAGLNEGTWPQLPAPDPWLAQRIRREFNLPGLERRIGLAAHDLAGAMGAPRVILTRAKRDRSGPAIASRFLLRLQAMAGGELKGQPRLLALARALDRPPAPVQISRPAPMPSAAQRHVDIAVTDMDRLKADPFAFYARKILQLKPLERVDADPGPAWRGTLAHNILQQWFEQDGLAYDALIARTQSALDSVGAHPVVRALWTPRLLAAIRFVGEETLRLAKEEGRTVAVVEEWGNVEISGIRMLGRADRVDRLADGSLAIVDYKTGTPPTPGSVTAGYALQLGLLGLMAARGGMKGIAGSPSRFEYWSLARNDNGGFGYVKTPFARQGDRVVDEGNFLDHAQSQAEKVIADYILGDAPFTAKLHPEYAPYGDYDQLMRLAEWYGREESDPT